MSEGWTLARRKWASRNLRENNPMHNPAVKRRYDRIMVAVRKDPQRRLGQSLGQKRSWTSKRRRKEHSKRMQKGSPHQELMQRNGNKKRIGIENLGAKEWWAGLSVEEKNDRAENMSVKISNVI
jgi:hypothetical protein